MVDVFLEDNMLPALLFSKTTVQKHNLFNACKSQAYTQSSSDPLLDWEAVAVSLDLMSRPKIY